MIESWLVGWGGKTHSQSGRVRARHFVHQVCALTDGLLLRSSSIARSIARDAIHRQERINVVTTAAVCSLGSVWLPLRSCKQAGAGAHCTRTHNIRLWRRRRRRRRRHDKLFRPSVGFLRVWRRRRRRGWIWSHAMAARSLLPSLPRWREGGQACERSSHQVSSSE